MSLVYDSTSRLIISFVRPSTNREEVKEITRDNRPGLSLSRPFPFLTERLKVGIVSISFLVSYPDLEYHELLAV